MVRWRTLCQGFKWWRERRFSRGIKSSLSLAGKRAAGELPRHVAIIMDGNGRWAERHGRERVFGHRAGVAALRRVVEEARELGILYLTVYAFSTENWGRPEQEVNFLMTLLEEYLARETSELLRQDIRLRVIGDWEGLPPGARAELEQSLAATAGCRSMTLTLALNYGGRDELVRAARKLARRVKAGELEPEEITAEALAACLDTAGMPDPDLLVRTSGELRLSNFLPWQTVYTEFWVTPILWPDFQKTDFREAISDYQRRKRRFGKLEG